MENSFSEIFCNSKTHILLLESHKNFCFWTNMTKKWLIVVTWQSDGKINRKKSVNLLLNLMEHLLLIIKVGLGKACKPQLFPSINSWLSITRALEKSNSIQTLVKIFNKFNFFIFPIRAKSIENHIR